MKETVIGSPIRWAGSKKRLLNNMLILFKEEKENYVEPFLGSGVVMLNVLNNIEVLKYKNIYVNDINSNIISFYKLLKRNPLELVKILTKLSEEYNIANDIEKEKMYYRIRDDFNSIDENKEAYFYFLMKVGFNGVYRENKMGKFNVPFGRKEKLLIPIDDLLTTSKLIKNVKFYNMSYDKFIKKMKKKGILKDCFMYCDPPYIPEDKLISQKQELYTNDNFNHDLFVKFLKENLEDSVLISMSKSTLSKKIYGDSFYEKSFMDIFRTINPCKKFKSTEILFSNYEINK